MGKGADDYETLFRVTTKRFATDVVAEVLRDGRYDMLVPEQQPVVAWAAEKAITELAEAYAAIGAGLSAEQKALAEKKARDVFASDDYLIRQLKTFYDALSGASEPSKAVAVEAAKPRAKPSVPRRPRNSRRMREIQETQAKMIAYRRARGLDCF